MLLGVLKVNLSSIHKTYYTKNNQLDFENIIAMGDEDWEEEDKKVC